MMTERKPTPLLPTAAARVFDGMPRADQRHALEVVARLRSTGQADPDLLAAALLHDAGKGNRLRLWHRVVAVLVEAFAPGRMDALASSARNRGAIRSTSTDTTRRCRPGRRSMPAAAAGRRLHRRGAGWA